MALHATILWGQRCLRFLRKEYREEYLDLNGRRYTEAAKLCRKETNRLYRFLAEYYWGQMKVDEAKTYAARIAEKTNA
jgi:hypothetical protein